MNWGQNGLAGTAGGGWGGSFGAIYTKPWPWLLAGVVDRIVSLSPLRNTLKFSPLGSTNVTLFANRVFADVIKMRSRWLRVGS